MEPSIPYAAGIIDGDGCIFCQFARSKRSMRILVRLGSVHPDPPLWLQEKFGGTVTVRKLKGRRVQYVWALMERDKVVAFLVAIRPYLIGKKVQARIALKLLEEEPISVNPETLRLKSLLSVAKHREHKTPLRFQS